MQIREITIENFRGIEHLTWRPQSSLVCLVGRGDIGKSTVLDAIELALSSRVAVISDTDFFTVDSTKQITVRVTVGELPEAALEESRFGMHLRGWMAAGGIRDEPQQDDEPVVTVELTVDATLDGEWRLYTDRGVRILSNRDRTLFGVVRIGAQVEQQLTWSRYSALSAATTNLAEAASTLTDGYRAARGYIAANGLPTLAVVAAAATTEAKRLGGYCKATAYGAAFDLPRTVAGLTALALHDGAVPLRLAGLGTRRLTSIAVQRMSVSAGAIVLIDELEHGLEPHRIRHALKVLRDSVEPTTGGVQPRGQVFLTTHSQTTLVELSNRQLAVCLNANGTATIRTPGDALQPMLRRVPEAVLAQRVLVCEGPTEVGLLRGLRDTWMTGRPFPFEARGACLADGKGSQAPATALELASLGHTTAVFRDSDVALDGTNRANLVAERIAIHEWSGNVATEQRIFLDVSWPKLQELLEIAYEERTEGSVLPQIANALGLPNLPSANATDWLGLKNEIEIRVALGKAAHKGGWFKNTTFGERVGEAIGPELRSNPATPLALLLADVEAWLYA